LPAPRPAETAAAQPQRHVSAAVAPPAVTSTTVDAKPPQPVVKPTQDMPPVQALE
jgi:hypothetical protein